ncbi:hypothetical protein FAP39_11650 [Shimia litoralis]|uniref:Uncharacterized protein n=1 Tax=Shimia litoralis TaxID=420403 RepID=A0A4U7N1K8_9RHOB|nr:hypothetical protein [Shimia litoralis]TKZ19247.1 hypothetical protein FAP39_11650 [Shimia litoralis]
MAVILKNGREGSKLSCGDAEKVAVSMQSECPIPVETARYIAAGANGSFAAFESVRVFTKV